MPGEEPGLRVVRMRRYPSRVAAVVVVVALVLLLRSVWTNPRFEWDVVGEYFFSASVLLGLGRMLLLTVVSMLIGTVLGGVLALMRLSASRALDSVAGGYVWFFRGIPLLVLVVLLYNFSALYPDLSLGIPGGPSTGRLDINELLTPTVVAILALSLHEAAYMCEIVRGGILSVDHGQTEAAKSVGMTPTLIFRRVVLPQAMRAIIPPTGNQVIAMLKATSLVSVIAYPELLYSVQAVYSRTYETVPLLLVATIWYLVVTSVLMVAQRYLEAFYSRGHLRVAGRRAAAVPKEVEQGV